MSNAPVAQLVRAQSLYLWGPWFESKQAHMKKQNNQKGRKLVFKGKRFNIYQWEQKLFNGKTATYETVKRSDSVIVIPIINDKVVIVKEKQPHWETYCYGFVAGAIDDSEKLESAAKRELREEIGMEFKDLHLVHSERFVPGIDWFAHTFIAVNKIKDVPTEFDEGGEDITPITISFEKLLKMVRAREFLYKPVFIENFVIANKEEKLKNIFRNPKKYTINKKTA
jgi:ADP-ribose pyrophosphatase